MGTLGPQPMTHLSEAIMGRALARAADSSSPRPARGAGSRRGGRQQVRGQAAGEGAGSSGGVGGR